MSMAMTAEQIKSLVQAALPDAQIELKDLAGDNDHWAITVTSNAFAGKSRVEQHRIVMGALNGGMGTTLHALQVTTKVSA
ncbi:MAG: BolA/IbaG family iron-sulfur metabolism protein [Rickettsiales bacterium]|nr:BolA/IbaG family iron-sulfur metabolism protein [Rickettsiales bacterium]